MRHTLEERFFLANNWRTRILNKCPKNSKSAPPENDKQPYVSALMHIQMQNGSRQSAQDACEALQAEYHVTASVMVSHLTNAATKEKLSIAIMDTLDNPNATQSMRAIWKLASPSNWTCALMPIDKYLAFSALDFPLSTLTDGQQIQTRAIMETHELPFYTVALPSPILFGGRANEVLRIMGNEKIDRLIKVFPPLKPLYCPQGMTALHRL